MNKKIKEKWVEALRSGEYKQGARDLHPIDGSFCVLGVLCDLYVKEHNNVDWEPAISYFKLLGYGSDLPPSVQAWAGLPQDPHITVNGCATPITSLNDDDMFNFVELADLIIMERL